MKILYTIVALLVSFSSFAYQEYNIDVLKVYAEEDFAPFNYYDEKEKLVGISTELVNKILTKATFKHTSIKSLPWARAYYLIQNQPNTLLFTMYRTPQREELFDWVGPVGKSDIVLIAKKTHEFNEEEFSIATLRSSASFQAIEKLGIKNERLIKLNDNNLGAKLLDMGRVDAWAVSIINAKHEMEEHGIDFNNFYIYKTIAERELYFAFNKETPQEIKDFFAQELKVMQKSGFIDELMKKYGL